MFWMSGLHYSSSGFSRLFSLLGLLCLLGLLGRWVKSKLKGRSSKRMRSGVHASMCKCVKAVRRSSFGTLRLVGLLSLLGVIEFIF